MRKPSRATLARREARRERIREARLNGTSNMPSPRAGLIAGGVCTVISAITVFSTELGVVAGLGLFGGLTLCALGGLALHAALRGPRRIANDPTWTNAVRVIEREDKHAALGHTAGGLSSADAVDGGLSSADPVDQT